MSWISVASLLCNSCPADITRLVVPHRIYTIHRHARGSWSEFVKPFVKRLETKLDIGVSVFMVCFYASTCFVVAAPALLFFGVILYSSSFSDAGTPCISARSAYPNTVFSVELVYSYTRLLAAGALHVNVIPVSHLNRCGYCNYTT